MAHVRPRSRWLTRQFGLAAPLCAVQHDHYAVCGRSDCEYGFAGHDESSLQWLGISDLIAEPEGPPWFLVPLRIAVWTGNARDTRPKRPSGTGILS